MDVVPVWIDGTDKKHAIGFFFLDLLFFFHSVGFYEETRFSVLRWIYRHLAFCMGVGSI